MIQSWLDCLYLTRVFNKVGICVPKHLELIRKLNVGGLDELDDVDDVDDVDERVWMATVDCIVSVPVSVPVSASVSVSVSVSTAFKSSTQLVTMRPSSIFMVTGVGPIYLIVPRPLECLTQTR